MQDLMFVKMPKHFEVMLQEAKKQRLKILCIPSDSDKEPMVYEINDSIFINMKVIVKVYYV